MAATAFP